MALHDVLLREPTDDQKRQLWEGVDLYGSGQLDKAIETLEALLPTFLPGVSDSYAADAHECLTKCYFNKGDVESGATNFRYVVEYYRGREQDVMFRSFLGEMNLFFDANPILKPKDL